MPMWALSLNTRPAPVFHSPATEITSSANQTFGPRYDGVRVSCMMGWGGVADETKCQCQRVDKLKLSTQHFPPLSLLLSLITLPHAPSITLLDTTGNSQ